MKGVFTNILYASGLPPDFIPVQVTRVCALSFSLDQSLSLDDTDCILKHAEVTVTSSGDGLLFILTVNNNLYNGNSFVSDKLTKSGVSPTFTCMTTLSSSLCSVCIYQSSVKKAHVLIPLAANQMHVPLGLARCDWFDFLSERKAWRWVVASHYTYNTPSQVWFLSIKNIFGLSTGERIGDSVALSLLQLHYHIPQSYGNSHSHTHAGETLCVPSLPLQSLPQRQPEDALTHPHWRETVHVPLLSVLRRAEGEAQGPHSDPHWGEALRLRTLSLPLHTQGPPQVTCQATTHAPYASTAAIGHLSIMLLAL